MSEALDKIHFVLTKEAIEDLPQEDYEVIERLQDGEAFRVYKFKKLAANFVVDDQNHYIPKEQAVKELGKITMKEWGDIAKRFVEAMQATAVPLANGTLSPSPSVASSPTPTMSPDGST